MISEAINEIFFNLGFRRNTAININITNHVNGLLNKPMVFERIKNTDMNIWKVKNGGVEISYDLLTFFKYPQ